ncbi:N-acetylmuramoyl-L-alanine amidase [Sinomicrobium kalidii]|uniref:N-acetylmuramoyl-L-alanine amidase family protein n=1 Tax=Sinomicrobium kalidii TaxID=2900738 RepID=UPI001E53F9C4|nr:N-acetylmuramoyl-L-alanine amidase [Sinomicrobium kalidii]UGU15415.1 N-acetylmuramoyl-L-alanine amidase [Sinomicrobium kalidii]
MQRILMLLYLGLLCPFGKGYPQEPLEGDSKIVVIDPGHGGTDPGAIGIGGIWEKDITLQIALEVARVAQESKDKNLEVYLTRYSDTLISLQDRARLARALRADLFLSIHCNWSSNSNAHGVKAFVAYPQILYSENTRKSIALALDLVTAFEKKFKRENRGVKFANFQVLRETIPFCPSVLLEVGFISNPGEVLFIMDNAYSSEILNPIKHK